MELGSANTGLACSHTHFFILCPRYVRQRRIFGSVLLLCQVILSLLCIGRSRHTHTHKTHRYNDRERMAAHKGKRCDDDNGGGGGSYSFPLVFIVFFFFFFATIDGGEWRLMQFGGLGFPLFLFLFSYHN